jgi:hypothetical protein
MEEIISKSDTTDDYDWHISVSKDKLAAQRIYTIVYKVKDFSLLNIHITLCLEDLEAKSKRIQDPIKHLMAGTPVGPACCSSFREAVVDLFINDELLSLS